MESDSLGGNCGSVCRGVILWIMWCGIGSCLFKKNSISGILTDIQISSVEEGIVMVGGELWRVIELYNYCVVCVCVGGGGGGGGGGSRDVVLLRGSMWSFLHSPMWRTHVVTGFR